MSKNKTKLLIFLVMAAALLSFKAAKAQQTENPNDSVIDYHGQPVVDSDSDALTDEGEMQIYHTDPNKADTDSDGFDDGVEVLAGMNPSDPSSYPGMYIAPEQTNVSTKQETPWAWYFARTGGLVGFLLLYVSILLGLSIRTPFLRKIISPVYSYSAHCWISLCATLFAFFHGFILIFDKKFGFTVFDILIPFSSKFETGLVALGIFAFYLMILLLITSYGRKFFSQKFWRLTHFTNIVLYIIVLIHAVKLGTDMQNPVVLNVFLWMNAFLIFIMLYNLESRIAESLKRKSEENLSR